MSYIGRSVTGIHNASEKTLKSILEDGIPTTAGSLNKISTSNVRASSTLAALATYTGTSEDVSAYARIGVAITSSNATDGVLWMEVSHDETNWSTIPRNCIINTSTFINRWKYNISTSNEWSNN